MGLQDPGGFCFSGVYYELWAMVRLGSLRRAAGRLTLHAAGGVHIVVLAGQHPVVPPTLDPP